MKLKTWMLVRKIFLTMVISKAIIIINKGMLI